MKKVISAIFIFVLLLIIFSCDKGFTYENKYSEAVPRSELKQYRAQNLSELHYFYKDEPKIFFPTYNIFIMVSITNSSGEIVEKLTISPKLVISYKNGFVKSFELGKYIRKENSLKPDSTYVFKNLFRLDTLKGFKESIFIHDVSSVEVFFNTEASNSIGFNLNLKNEKKTKLIITGQWDELKKFSNSKNLLSFEQVYSCYPMQLVLLQNQYNSIFQDQDIIGNYRYYHILQHLKYERLLNIILDKYYLDLTNSNAVVSSEFKKLFKNYRKQYSLSLYERTNMLELNQNYDEIISIKIDSLEKSRIKNLEYAVKLFSDAMKELGRDNDIIEIEKSMKNFDKKFLQK